MCARGTQYWVHNKPNIQRTKPYSAGTTHLLMIKADRSSYKYKDKIKLIVLLWAQLAIVPGNRYAVKLYRAAVIRTLLCQ